ncbi:MAG: hypothetical protein QXR81_08355 [Candidatus Nezhaarchaeales archaeon]
MRMAAIAAVSFLMGAFSFSLATVNPFQRWLNYSLNWAFPNLIPEAVDQINMLFRGVISEPEYLVNMQKLGYAQDFAKGLMEAAKNLPTLSELIELRRRNAITEDEYLTYAKKLRFDEEDAKKIYSLSSRLLSWGDLVTLYWRGYINKKELKENAYKLGYDEETVDKLLKVAEYFPSPADLVRFAVREVYTPEVVEKFRLDEDLPPKFLEEAAKAGLPKEQAVNYWRAHWELPSLTMGFEMFHRGIINEDELKLLMRTLDVMPFWRDKLIQLSYVPFTRVDVRRMYHAGVLTREEVKRAYLDLGYSPEKAEAMTRWTEASAVEEEKLLTKSQVLELYERGDFDREKAKQYLKLLGYSDEASEYLIKLRDHEIANKELKEQLELLQLKFEKGEIDEEEYFDSLTRLGLPANAIEKQRLKAIRRKAEKVVLPSLSTVLHWYEVGVINEEAFFDYMKLLNVREEDIIRYKAEVELRILERLRRKEKPPKLPDLHTVLRWYALKIITVDEAKDYLTAIGYKEPEISRFIQEIDVETLTKERRKEKLPKIPPISTLQRWLILGLIDLNRFIEFLTEAGYQPDVIENYIKEAIVKMGGELVA